MNTEETRVDKDPAQNAWNAYIDREYIDSDIIITVRRAFLAAYKVGYSDGFDDADAGG